MRHLYDIDHRGRWRGLIWSGVLFAVLCALFLYAALRAGRVSDSRETQLLSDAIRRAAVTCYAVEGKYPSTLDYISENYGVVVDTERFIVRYDAFSENLMPNITVLKREGVS